MGRKLEEGAGDDDVGGGAWGKSCGRSRRIAAAAHLSPREGRCSPGAAPVEAPALLLLLLLLLASAPPVEAAAAAALAATSCSSSASSSASDSARSLGEEAGHPGRQAAGQEAREVEPLGGGDRQKVEGFSKRRGRQGAAKGS